VRNNRRARHGVEVREEDLRRTDLFLPRSVCHRNGQPNLSLLVPLTIARSARAAPLHRRFKNNACCGARQSGQVADWVEDVDRKSAVEADINEPVARLVTLQDIQDAAVQIGDVVRKTPFGVAYAMSKISRGGRQVLLKHEYLQRTGSYKCVARSIASRVYLPVLVWSPRLPVITRKAFALSAETHRRKATIFMPASAPVPKREATHAYGADGRVWSTVG